MGVYDGQEFHLIDRKNHMQGYPRLPIIVAIVLLASTQAGGYESSGYSAANGTSESPGVRCCKIRRSSTRFSPNQFVIVEVRKNQQARIEHLAQPQFITLRAELDPFLLAPTDERLYAIIITNERSLATADAVYAVAHIDILGPNPAGRDASCQL